MNSHRLHFIRLGKHLKSVRLPDRFCAIDALSDVFSFGKLCRLCVSLLLLIGLTGNSVLAKTAAEVFAQVSECVVVIHNYDNSNKLQSLGSGIVISSGHVITNYHVIEKAGRLTVLYQGKEYPARPGYTDRFRDVCSLDVSGLEASKLIPGDTNQLKVGSKVYAIGAPQGLELTFSDGIISGLRDVDKGHYIQTTAPISLGSSGGGLFDEEGRLIGIPTYFFKQGQQLNFALPVEWIIDLPNRHAVANQVNRVDSDWTYQVNSLEEKQDWGGMIVLCTKWTTQVPSSSDAWGYLGFAHLQKGDLALAIDALQNAIRIRPDYAHYWADLGIAYGREGETVRKIEAYRQAVRINNDFALGWINLGIAYVQNGDFDKAVDAYQQAVRINPDDASVWFNTGLVCRDAGQAAKAVDAFEHAVRIAPENAQYRLKLGEAYGLIDQRARQIEAYNEALRIKQDYDDAWVSLGVVYGIAGREAEEREAYLKALRINPGHNAALFNLGKDYLEHNNREEAREIYSRLKRLNPELAQLFFTDFNKLMFPRRIL
ncbi:tetratricopeptide repeat protein [Chlorobium ferrooxidans]|uniref:TPR repeat:Tetratricopeptide TPR_4 n=1 Tax=Chlorobium ferrooxidans DSM 13031 TaxID=377431 RepID=Q0YS38_9CHLB|nr:tetratricopeptide repeat protein [Chlorobium ferrooxidans]EAT59151.1 TPR repeat:Tetratricopeptide TPR_4 [Chlorobium ferrooxidans DSM 13031]